MADAPRLRNQGHLHVRINPQYCRGRHDDESHEAQKRDRVWQRNPVGHDEPRRTLLGPEHQVPQGAQASAGAESLLIRQSPAGRIVGDQHRFGRHLVGDACQDAELERRPQHRRAAWDDQIDLFGAARLQLRTNRAEIVVGIQKDKLLRPWGDLRASEEHASTAS